MTSAGCVPAHIRDDMRVQNNFFYLLSLSNASLFLFLFCCHITFPTFFFSFSILISFTFQKNAEVLEVVAGECQVTINRLESTGPMTNTPKVPANMRAQGTHRLAGSY